MIFKMKSAIFLTVFIILAFSPEGEATPGATCLYSCQSRIFGFHDALTMCEVRLNTPPCSNVPKNMQKKCSSQDIPSPDSGKESTSIWDYIRGCTQGFVNSVMDVLMFAKKILSWIYHSIVDPVQTFSLAQRQLAKHLSNVNLYLHNEFEKRYQREKPGPARALSALAALGGTLGQTIWDLFFGLLDKGFPKFRCLKKEAKSESICQLVSDTFMSVATWFPILTKAKNFLTVKQFQAFQKTLARLNDSLLSDSPRVSQKHFTRLARIEDTLDKPLLSSQKQALTKVSSLLSDTEALNSRGIQQSATRILKSAGFNAREIRQIMEDIQSPPKSLPSPPTAI